MYTTLAALVLRGSFHCWHFIQDDTFISLRSALNLLHGHGLVFNPGQRVEGITNIAWTLLGTAVTSLGLDAVTVWQVVGVFSAISAA